MLYVKNYYNSYALNRKKETEKLLRTLDQIMASLNNLSQNLKDLIKLR